MLLTPKHLIIVHNNGRFEWAIKYDIENNDEGESKPFAEDKHYSHEDETIKYLLFN